MSSPISGFTAIPNPQMLAFMPIQSYLMMYFAGAGWQIGKRKISAIPNDKFNNMSANDLLKGFTADLRETIPTLERSMLDVTPLVRTLIEQYGDFIKVAIDTIPQLAQNIVGGQAGANLQSNIQGFDNILKWVRQQFPGLPVAEARLMAIQIDKANRNLDPNKFQAPNVGQQQATQKQLLFEQQQRDFDRLKVSQVGTPPIVPQVAAHVSVKKAGQSQIMERLRLIRLIAQLGKDAKFLDAEPARKHAFNRMLFEQQMLVNLLARYTF